MNEIIISGFTRISKAAARKLYNNGHKIRICAVKLSPVNVWGAYTDARLAAFTAVSSDGFNTTVARNKDFETVVNAFEAYNCNAKTGKYAAFYKMEG